VNIRRGGLWGLKKRVYGGPEEDLWKEKENGLKEEKVGSCCGLH